jgi:hypothetical protein
MDRSQIDRVRRTLRRRPRPPWRVLWRPGTPEQWTTVQAMGPRWRTQLTRMRAGWALLWTERLRRDLDLIYRLAACRRGRHRDAHLLADDLIGSPLAHDYPELAVCEVCGRAVDWPNGKPSVEAW